MGSGETYAAFLGIIFGITIFVLSLGMTDVKHRVKSLENTVSTLQQTLETRK